MGKIEAMSQMSVLPTAQTSKSKRDGTPPGPPALQIARDVGVSTRAEPKLQGYSEAVRRQACKMYVDGG